MTRGRISIAIALVVVLQSRFVLADRKADAQAEYDRGHALAAAGDHVAAVAAFDRAYAIDARPEILYAKAQAQRLAGACPEAIATYRAFLATNPKRPLSEQAPINIARCFAALLERAKGHEAGSDWPGAIAAYRAVLAAEPPAAEQASARAAVERCQRGLAAKAAGLEASDCAAASAAYEQLIASEPAPSLREQARDAITRCAQKQQADRDAAARRAALVVTGRTRLAAGDCDGAVRAFDALLAAGPTAGEASEARAALAGCARAGLSPRRIALPLGLTIGAAATLGVSTLFVIRARGHADATRDAGDAIGWRAEHDAWGRDRVIAGVAGGIGGAIAVAAIVAWVWPQRDREPPTASIAPGGVAIGGRW